MQLGLAAPFKHFSDLWQQCALQPPDVQLFAKVRPLLRQIPVNVLYRTWSSTQCYVPQCFVKNIVSSPSQC